jgi:hypothetical protein
MKPKCIVEYSCKLGAVTQTDMLLIYVQCIHKSVKWYKKLAFHILDIALLSAHSLCLMQNEKVMPLYDFQMSAIGRVLEKHKEGRILSMGGRC